MSRSKLDPLDRSLLNALQDDFPVDARPYRVLAERLSAETGLELDEDEVFRRTEKLRDRGLIRRLGGVFNSGPLGFRTTLCALKAPPELLAEAAAFINARPEVTHNYVRDCELNVWFTFTHRDPIVLENFLARLRAVKGLGPVFEFEASKVYKIRAVFDPASSAPSLKTAAADAPGDEELKTVVQKA
jgi:DNA-binding Lrp family transcriptional regulator